jgi:hypothetical protein
MSENVNKVRERSKRYRMRELENNKEVYLARKRENSKRAYAKKIGQLSEKDKRKYRQDKK